MPEDSANVRGKFAEIQEMRKERKEGRKEGRRLAGHSLTHSLTVHSGGWAGRRSACSVHMQLRNTAVQYIMSQFQSEKVFL